MSYILLRFINTVSCSSSSSSSSNHLSHIMCATCRLTDLVLTTPAILISPVYRLLPEASGTDLLTDIHDFWTWLHSPYLPIIPL